MEHFTMKMAHINLDIGKGKNWMALAFKPTKHRTPGQKVSMNMERKKSPTLHAEMEEIVLFIVVQVPNHPSLLWETSLLKEI